MAVLAAGLMASAAWAETAAGPAAPARLVLTVGKSLTVDSPARAIRRVAVADGDLVETVAVSPRELLLNGKKAGETSLILWQEGGGRLVYDLVVRVSSLQLEAVRQQVARDFPSDQIDVTLDNDTAFVRGTVKDTITGERVMAMAGTLGKTVNLLRVEAPPVETQVLLKVRFVAIEHSASRDLGVNLASGVFGQNSATGTGTPVSTDGGSAFSLGSAVNLFLSRKDFPLMAAITALQSKKQLQILEEPNLLAVNGKAASFLAGGEFPVPTLQPSSSGSTIAVQWKEYGVRLNFTPNVTARGTIRLAVEPEVSSLNYNNSVTISGFTIPAMSTRRVKTEVELESGQTFILAGLLDNQTTDSFSKIPGISNIPVLGKLFQSKTVTKTSSELLVIITPEIVRPLGVGQKAPDLDYSERLLTPESPAAAGHPGLSRTGETPVGKDVEPLTFQKMQKIEGKTPTFQSGSALPAMLPATLPAAAPAAGSAPATPPGTESAPATPPAAMPAAGSADEKGGGTGR
jgi:pilus assembly protein CpaC